ncbi:MAG: DUF3461 family protein [Pseudomonadales bacterium]|nr:DUF3461 family protein [Pseudomonadales bacterium]NRA18412.1 DUF3461 family protein [Oceanospirillaceae bacterium]
MSDYPTLEELDVISTEEVVRYSLSREAHLDVLKIHYKRKPGSFLSKSKKFHFCRGLNHMGEPRGDVHCSPQHVSPQLLLAIEELRSLMAQRPMRKRAEIKNSIYEKLDNLEVVIDSKLQHLRKQLDDLD